MVRISQPSKGEVRIFKILGSSSYLLEYKYVDPYPFVPFVNKDGLTNQHYMGHRGIEPSKGPGEKDKQPYKPSSISWNVQFLDELLKNQSRATLEI